MSNSEKAKETEKRPPIPHIHLFWPNDGLHYKGLCAMQDYVKMHKIPEDERVPYYQKQRRTDIDWGEETRDPTWEDYEDVLVPEGILVEKLMRMHIGDAEPDADTRF
jgi:hypothetical protein